MRLHCDMIIERQALLTALTADGPVQRLVDPDFLMMAPAGRGIGVWTAVLEADFTVRGWWDQAIIVSRSGVIALLTRNTAPTACLTFAGNTLCVDRTMIRVIKSEYSRAITTNTLKPVRAKRQHELFPVGAPSKLRPRRSQLTVNGLPLFK